MRTLVFALLAVVAACFVPSANAATITTTLSAADIHGGDSSTASFSDAFVTLTPFIGAAPATFNDNPTRLGIDDAGTNVAAFNDPDTDPNNGNEEKLVFDFTSGAGLSQLSYDFSRADGPGPDDGVVISGFLADPNATFSVVNPDLFAVYDAVAGEVRLNIPGSLFNNNDILVDFDYTASRDQTLTMTTTDTTQAGAQMAVLSISYTIPEPTAASITGVALLAGLFRRRD